MQWLYPAGGWALMGLAAVLALYILRREYREFPISSTYLWQRTLQDQTASKPFQRLKSNLLMFLQLLIVLLLALSLLRPLLPGQQEGGEMVMIFDLSLSMQTETIGLSRIDRAVNDAGRMVDGMRAGDKVSILTAGTSVKNLLSRSSDKQAIWNVLRSIQAENGRTDTNGALSLAKAMGREIKDLNIILFSDNYDGSVEGIQYVAAGAGVANRAIVSLTAARQEYGVAALARIANYGKAATVTVECYADGIISDVRTAEIAENGTAGVRFDLPAGATNIRAKIVEDDGLLADNIRYTALRDQTRQKIVLVGRDNIFLEKAFLQRGNMDLVRASAADAAAISDAALFVYDGVMPEPMPEHGALLIIQPASPIFEITPGEKKAPEYSLRISSEPFATQFSDHVTFTDVAVKQYAPLSGGQPILISGGDALITAGEENGRRYMVMGFDMHESNWVMKYDFPIFMMHGLNYLMPDTLSDVHDAQCGDILALHLDGRSEAASVLTPGGESFPLAPPYPALPFTGTNIPGIYALQQTLVNDTAADAPFAVNVPVSESDVRFVANSTEGSTAQAGTQYYGLELTGILLFALLALMMAEWWVSCRAG